MDKKLIFIAHPIRGNVAGNMAKVLVICEQIHKDGHIPVAPYLVSLQYLNDEVIEDRELGVEANLVCLQRGFVDEVWLYGDKISEGMKRELTLAKELKIPVVAKSEGTSQDLAKLLEKSEILEVAAEQFAQILVSQIDEKMNKKKRK